VTLFDGWFERASDDTHEADLVTFPAEGTSVVWLGRTATGSIASVVVADDYHSCVVTLSADSSV
jgi:hypothetical protein